MYVNTHRIIAEFHEIHPELFALAIEVRNVPSSVLSLPMKLDRMKEICCAELYAQLYKYMYLREPLPMPRKVLQLQRKEDSGGCKRDLGRLCITIALC